MSKSISARIDDSLHTKLLQQCNLDGLTVSDELNQILNKSLTCSSSIGPADKPKEKDSIDRSNLEQWNKDLVKKENEKNFAQFLESLAVKA